MTFGRALSDFGKLSVAEKKLVEACRVGDVAIIGTGERPAGKTPGNTIRLDFFRFLALGGDRSTPVHERGVRTKGAWIDGGLDLESCACPFSLLIENSTVNGDVIAHGAVFKLLSLSGSKIENFTGDRLRLTENLFLGEGFEVAGEVRLLGARIGGDLDCTEGSFEPKEGNALFCDRAVITGALFFRKLTQVSGQVSLAACEVATLVDDAASWAKTPKLILDGFRYGRIVGGPADAAARIAWLRQQPDDHLKDDFRPQPWEQLIKVLHEMGHDDAAKKITIAKQQALRQAGKIRGIAWGAHWLYGRLAGYGYRPLRTVAAMSVVWFFGCLVFGYADRQGWMAPASAAIQVNQTIREACGSPQGVRLTAWTKCPALPKEYTPFNPLIYSLDLVLPLVDLKQDKDWAPIVTLDDGVTWTWARAATRFYMWFEILFGWLASLLLVAVLGNMVKKD